MQQILVRLPIGDHIYHVEEEGGEAVMTDKIPLPTEVFSIPGRQSRYFDNPSIQVFFKLYLFTSATHTLSFLATLPPLSWVTYGLTRIEETNLGKEQRNIVPIERRATKEEEVSSNGGQTLFYLPEVRVKFL